MVMDSKRYKIHMEGYNFMGGENQPCKDNNINSPNWCKLNHILLGYFMDVDKNGNIFREKNDIKGWLVYHISKQIKMLQKELWY